MNKAFTKESDFDPGLEVSIRPRNVLPAGVKNYITPAGARRLRRELTALVEVERPRLATELSRRVEAGRQEEAEHRADQHRLHELDEQIRWLSERVAGLEVIDPAQHAGNQVRFGATVTVIDPDGAERVYTIVGVDEADPAEGRISWVSPLAKALLSAREGDEVVARLPRTDAVLEIDRIDYPRATNG
ncbi:MAG TPA: GreA/GreB family elongation factor [Acidobacteriota bacterium]|nr:GreA/GreB family elongation factor [Acidobacteriota bacterium]